MVFCTWISVRTAIDVEVRLCAVDNFVRLDGILTFLLFGSAWTSPTRRATSGKDGILSPLTCNRVLPNVLHVIGSFVDSAQCMFWSQNRSVSTYPIRQRRLKG